MTGPHPDLPNPQFSFNTFLVSWGGTTTPEFGKFLTAVKPAIVQVGFYGPMFHGYADNPKSTGYPMQLPVSGQREALVAQTEVNAQIHKHGLKVIGHFQMVNVIADLKKRNNFFVFYEKHWHEDLLGPKPHPDVDELLQRDAKGNIITRKHYVDYVGLCLSSPHARKMLKQMLKLAIDAGVDGIMTNYNYHWGCACPYCQKLFKAYLGKRYTAEQLKAKFGITDLATHRFERIAAEIPGYPDPKKATPLDWEAMRWGALAFKQAFDEVLITYGRSLKPDLVLATWNHLGNLGIGEERAFLPVEQWGKGEHYFWYSGGYGPTKLKEHKAGDGWLNCLYLREMTGGKPFMLGKYEPIRMRNSIAEGVATGGSGMGLYFGYRDSAGFEVGARYLRFLAKNEALYWPCESFAEVALVLPRQSAWLGHKDGWDAFRSLGNMLSDEHVLFDVLADENVKTDRLEQYQAVILPAARALSDAQLSVLAGYVHQGGVLLALGDAAQMNERGEPRAQPDLFREGKCVRLPTLDASAGVKALRDAVGARLSTFEAPWTVRVSAFSQPDKLILHLVNYNRDEETAKSLRGPAAECPIAVERVGVGFRLRDGVKVESLVLLSPDEKQKQTITWQQEGKLLRFRIPRVLVYGVVEIQLGASAR